MKNHKRAIILVLTLVSCFAWGKGRKRKSTKPQGPPKFYYTLPVDASAEWEFAIPECQEIALEDYKMLKNKNECQAKGSGEACLSRADIELKKTGTNEKKTFGLNYIIHDKKADCQEDRAKLLPPST